MNIEVTNMKPEIAIAIKRTAVTMDNMVEVMDEAAAKMLSYLSEQGRQPSGAPYSCYTNCSEDFSQFDMEFGVPVSEAVSPDEEIFMSKTCEGKAIEATHKGPYNTLEQAYNALMDYGNDNKLEFTGVYYDFYLNDPTITPESELLTRIVFPIN
jgi:effector-binding domain-containing protein